MRLFERKAFALALVALSFGSLARAQDPPPPDPFGLHPAVIYEPGKFPLFSFPELISLSKDDPLSPELGSKLTAVFQGVVLDNSAASTAPTPLQVKHLGPSLRAAEWNIERGENFDWIVSALDGEDAFRASLREEKPGLRSSKLRKITGQARLLHEADVLILNEVDLGMTRSQYHDVARELAAKLHMNFVYGVEFVEVDPLKLGSEELTSTDTGGDEQLRTELESELKADPGRYKGLHGSAILSRYPISNVRLLYLPGCHDWFDEERQEVAKVEQGKRFASNKIFLEKIEREIRRGGRMAIVADLKVDGAPGGTVTVVNTHLENKCTPACRRGQMQALLAGIRDIPNPVLLAGDLNTTGTDASTLSIAYLAKSKATDYRFWGRQALMMTTPLPSLTALNYFKKYTDPTVRDIKFLSDNKEAALFSDVERFRFADEGSFDFRGNRDRTVNGTGKRLANSNQRARKGFVYTFSLPRDFKGFVGRSKLDWFFIKPGSGTAEEKERLAPWYARTMVDLNKAPKQRISDHSPITVDLPLNPSAAP